MNLEFLRNQIDQIDHDMMILFKKRMEISKQIGEYKKLNAVPILDEKREKELLEKRRIDLNDENLWHLYEAFIKELMHLSKVNQK
ncbi:MAG: chorismate mutase [Acholeplasmataceae bacterium]|nr:chorismate mutase [Acholeplasmataceae bacterium]